MNRVCATEVMQCAITQSDLHRGRNDNQAPNGNLLLVQQMRHMQCNGACVIIIEHTNHLVGPLHLASDISRQFNH